MFKPVIGVIASGKFPRPVIGKPHAFQLVTHGADILPRPFGGVHAPFNGGVFSRQAKRIPAHGVQHVEPLGAFHPGNDITQRVVADMADMNAPRWIGEHFQDIIFWLIRVDAGSKATSLIPALLPFFLNGGCVETTHG